MRYEVMPESFRLEESKGVGINWKMYIDDFMKSNKEICMFSDIVPKHFKSVEVAQCSISNYIRKHHLRDKLKTRTAKGVLYLIRR